MTAQRGRGLAAWTWPRIQWSLRKVTLPIQRHDLVLDVGSGGRPHPRADVLLERYWDGAHRHGVGTVVDRPLVLGDGCRMPFRDKAFDYVIAFHVLEHMSDPAAFLSELQRVGKAGYIETPNALFERLVPYDVHLLEVMDRDGRLWIRKKESARPDAYLSDVELVTRAGPWNQLFYSRPELFHVRFHWKNEIPFTVVNPSTDVAWFHLDEDETEHVETMGAGADPRGWGLQMLKRWHDMRGRRPFVAEELLACPECHGRLEFRAAAMICTTCDREYTRNRVFDFVGASQTAPVRGSEK